MNRLLIILLLLALPSMVMAQIRIYLLPEAGLAKNPVLLSDVSKIEGAESGKLSSITIPPVLYKDSIIDRRELNDFLLKEIQESFCIFGSGVKVTIEKPVVEPAAEEKTATLKKGDMVSLTIRKGPITIETTGKVSKNGNGNDEVEVRLKNGRTLKGRTSGDGKVEVFL